MSHQQRKFFNVEFFPNYGIYIHTYINTYIHMYIHRHIHTHIYTYIHIHTYTHTRGGSGGPAATVWAGPLFEFLTLLLAINHYKPTN